MLLYGYNVLYVFDGGYRWLFTFSLFSPGEVPSSVMAWNSTEQVHCDDGLVRSEKIMRPTVGQESSHCYTTVLSSYRVLVAGVRRTDNEAEAARHWSVFETSCNFHDFLGGKGCGVPFNGLFLWLPVVKEVRKKRVSREFQAAKKKDVHL